MKRILTVLLIATMLMAFVSCDASVVNAAKTQEPTQQAQEDEAATETPQTDDAHVDTTIILSDNGAQIDGEGAAQDGNTVTITQGGDYRITGEMSAGSVVVDAEGQYVNLLLGGVSITNPNGPAILVQRAYEAFITLEAGTENSLADGGDSEYDAALYGSTSVIIDGDGILNVAGNVEEGIASDGDITINGGTLNIEAKDDGINASEDGVSAIAVNGGNISINAGGDGIDSNGTLTITDGYILTHGAVEDANGGLDADGDITISGGTVLATGAMNSMPTSAGQLFLSASVEGTAGSTLSIRQGSDELISTIVPQAYQTVFFSSASLEEGVTYDIYIDDELITSTDTASAVGGMGGPGGGPPGDMGGGEMPEWDGEGEPPELPEGMEEGEWPEPPDGAAPPQRPDGQQNSTQTT